MNQNEFVALADDTLPHAAVVLYVRCFRRFMNYQTGLVSMSLHRMIQELEFNPVQGSNSKPVKASREGVRGLVRHLLRVGLLQVVEKGSAQRNKAAIYRCLLARNDVQDYCGQFDGQPMNTQGGTTHKTPPQANKTTVVQFRNNQGTHRGEQHRSGITVKEDIYIAREDLCWDDEFKHLAYLVGFAGQDDELEALFDAFRFAAKAVGVVKALFEHKNEWRGFCANVRANRKRQATLGGDDERQQRFTQPRTNATHSTMRRTATSAEHAAVGLDILDRGTASAGDKP